MRMCQFIAWIIAAIALSGCKESSGARAKRLVNEEQKIHNQTVKAVLENDGRFVSDVADQDRFLADLRQDVARCRAIEAELRSGLDAASAARLGKVTSKILELIENRETQNQNDRRISRRVAERLGWKVGAERGGDEGTAK